MRIVMTFPGRFGDILWAMPSARALAETYDQPIDLVLSPKYGSLAELLRLQPYLASVAVDPAWELREEAPIQPRVPPTPINADLVVHGGYEGWPRHPLPLEIWSVVERQVVSLCPLDLSRPWITTLPSTGTKHIAVGFSDEWFELKYGLAELLELQFPGDLAFFVSAAPGSRWEKEADCRPLSWLGAARWIATCDLFLGCCSALHVLAVALGKPCVIVEPSEMRWNPVFWPLGMDGPQVTCVKGGDGRPTFDARHVADTLRQVLSTVRTGGTR